MRKSKGLLTLLNLLPNYVYVILQCSGQFVAPIPVSHSQIAVFYLPIHATVAPMNAAFVHVVVVTIQQIIIINQLILFLLIIF